MTTWFFAGMTIAQWLPLLLALGADVHRLGVGESMIRYQEFLSDDDNGDEEDDDYFVAKIYFILSNKIIVLSPICWLISAICN